MKINNVAVAVILFKRTESPPGIINQIVSSFEHVYIVDNTPESYFSTFSFDNANFIQNRNIGGLAGAYNRVLQSIRDTELLEYVMFLDDDTEVVTFDFVSPTILDNFLFDHKVAGVGFQFVDPDTNLFGGYLGYREGNYYSLSRPLTSVTSVEFLINSMTIWRKSFLIEIDGYDESLLVDHIDTSICLRAKVEGYKLLALPAPVFIHKIGARSHYRLFGRYFQTGGHCPSRRELIARNTILLLKQYAKHIPGLRKLFLLRLGYEVMGIVIAESDKTIKLVGLLRGVLKGWFGIKY